MKALALKHEVFGAGLSIFVATFIFYGIDPYVAGAILVEKIQKTLVYCLYLIGFNLALRARHRDEGRDPYSNAAYKAHIKLTLFFCAMFALMDLSLFLSRI